MKTREIKKAREIAEVSCMIMRNGCLSGSSIYGLQGFQSTDLKHGMSNAIFSPPCLIASLSKMAAAAVAWAVPPAIKI